MEIVLVVAGLIIFFFLTNTGTKVLFLCKYGNDWRQKIVLEYTTEVEAGRRWNKIARMCDGSIYKINFCSPLIMMHDKAEEWPEIIFVKTPSKEEISFLSDLEERREKKRKITEVEKRYGIEFEGITFEWREDFVSFLKKQGALIKKTRVNYSLSTLRPSTAKVADREDRSIISYKGATVLLIEKYEAGSETRNVPAFAEDQPGNPNPIGVIPEYYNFKRGTSEVPFLSEVTRRCNLLTEEEREGFGNLFYT